MSSDLVRITETWLSEAITDAEIALPGMSILRNDRPSRGGGVVLYYRSELHIDLIDDPEVQIVDALWCRLQLSRGDACLLGVVYRPPSATLEMDNRLASTMKTILSQSYSHILLVGDFNIHTIETPACINEHFKMEVQEIISGLPLYNHITSPTRFRTGNKPGVLDLVFTNEELMIETVSIESPLGRSDHATLMFKYICYAEYSSENTEECQLITDYGALVKLINATNWAFLAERSPDIA
ncbi:unnamed protein product [Dicrocoelium dendriticum]|nr:unnamed protein product [Dicrocoelium dendriticum]